MKNRDVYFFLIVLFLSGCSTGTPRSLKGLDPHIGQAIIVHPVKEKSPQAQLSAWQRQGNTWRREFLVRAVIGRNGLAPAGQKREGDGQTPSGIYNLGPAFGYAPTMGTGLMYRQATDHDFWVDDARSMQYNQWVHGTPQANSFERLRRPDDLYQYAVVIQYNDRPVVPGAGSAIFMHTWRHYYSPTAGCVALNQRYLRKILNWLQARENPVILLGKTNA